MNISVLKYLATDGDYHIREIVETTKYNPEATLAVTRKLISSGGDVENLSQPEKYHYETFIFPLIFNVQCQGTFGPETCISGTVDDETLLEAYLEDDFRCQQCRHDAGNIPA